MKSKIIHFVLQRFNLSLSVILFLVLLVTTPGFSKDPSAQKTVRVAVKTNVPLTQDIVDELAQYGSINSVLWKVDIIDMQVTESAISTITALPQVELVERDRIVENALQGVSSDDLLNGLSLWQHDMINVTDGATHTRVLPLLSNGDQAIGAGVYVAVLDAGMCNKWRDYFPEATATSPFGIDTGRARSFVTAASFQNIGNPPNPTQVRWDNDDCGESGENGKLNGMHAMVVTSQILGYHEPSHLTPAQGLNLNGVAPKATVIPIRMFLHDSFSVVDAVDAINYVIEVAGELAALDPPARLVLNNSWSGTPEESALLKGVLLNAIDAGVIVVAVAGNCGPEPISEACVAGGGIALPWSEPELQEVITVGAVGWKQEGREDLLPNWRIFDVLELISEPYIANFSSRGEALDLLASGSAIVGPLQIIPGADPGKGSATSRGDIGNGTSYASPQVAGAAALLLQENASLSQAELQEYLTESALWIPQGTHTNPVDFNFHTWGDCPQFNDYCLEEQGAGLMQVDRALDCAMNTCGAIPEGACQCDTSVIPACDASNDITSDCCKDLNGNGKGCYVP